MNRDSDEANLAPITAVALDSWESPGALGRFRGSPENPGPHWSESEAESPPVTGCEALTFEPTVVRREQKNRKRGRPPVRPRQKRRRATSSS